GPTGAIFPVDAVTIDYLRRTGRAEEQLALVEAYAKRQGLWHDPSKEVEYSEYLELDLSTVVPSIAGPKRPQDRIVLTEAKESFREVLPSYATGHPVPGNGDGSFPASDPATPDSDNESGGAAPEHQHAVGRASDPVQVEGEDFSIDHGIVSI